MSTRVIRFVAACLIVVGLAACNPGESPSPSVIGHAPPAAVDA